MSRWRNRVARLGVTGVLLLALDLAACAGGPRRTALPVPEAPSEEVTWTLFLIGDAGAPEPDDPVLEAMTRAASIAPDRSTVVFLGDNIYPAGMPDSSDPTRPVAEARLLLQLAVFRRSGVRGFMIPGNHDWDYHQEEGFIAILRQEEFVAAHGGGLIEYLPGAGCPGPAVRDIGPGFRLVFLDTHWFLHSHVKPEDPTSSCPADNDAEVSAALAAAVQGGDGRPVLVLGHHPLASGGEHGGYFTLQDHLFPLRHVKSWMWLPLPIIGSLYPVIRSTGVSRQDIANSRNREMRRAIESAMARAPPLAYVSGHEHNLQVLEGESARWLLVSGTGYYGHAGAAYWLGATRFAAQAGGFMRVDALRSGRFRLGVIGVEPDATTRELFSMYLE